METDSDRYTCPQCGGDDITTIHYDFYCCDTQGCEAHYNPESLTVTYVPVRYAIGFCPRCETNARDNRCTDVAEYHDDPLRNCFECPVCEYFWEDDRLAGRDAARLQA